jgi:hypothetical protein
MNDFSEIENELRKLRPLPPSPQLLSRVESALRDPGAAVAGKVIRPDRFQFNWMSLGLGLAAAALLLLFARLSFHISPPVETKVVSRTPSAVAPAPLPSAQFIPAGATQVVYHTQDEGLLFPRGSDQPLRRVRSQTRETLQWRNPGTGASLRVSYPAEQIELIPVSGQ